MADPAQRLSENAPGEFFVDASCIDCETCMIVAPDLFGESDRELAYVLRQPGDAAERHRALMALVACPTRSIGTVSRLDARRAAASFPEPVTPDGDVLYCGYAHEESFGASSYLIRRPGGNVLVDSPRAAGPLLKRLDALGGVALMFLTHRDDVADHETFRRRYGCTRVLHADDMGPGTAGIERRLEGEEPVALAEDLLAIPVPGHTRGSAALLFDRRVLFSGDHLWGDGRGRLAASRRVAWHSWRRQIASMERLLDVPFQWVLPGPGRPWRAASEADRRRQLQDLLRRMRGGDGEAPGSGLPGGLPERSGT